MRKETAWYEACESCLRRIQQKIETKSYREVKEGRKGEDEVMENLVYIIPELARISKAR